MGLEVFGFDLGICVRDGRKGGTVEMRGCGIQWLRLAKV